MSTMALKGRSKRSTPLHHAAQRRTRQPRSVLYQLARNAGSNTETKKTAVNRGGS